MRRLIRVFLLLVAAAAVAAAAWYGIALATFDRDAWLEDYAVLKRHMEVAYANLDWMREARGVDTRALDRRTTAALMEARTDRAARGAIRDFVQAFGDPHLGMRAPAPRWWRAVARLWQGGDEEPVVVPAGASGDEACSALGYRAADLGFRFEPAALPGWRETAAEPFPAGTFRLKSGRSAGIVRVAEFGEHRYPEVCAAVWSSAPPEGPCGEACQDTFRVTIQDSLTARLAAATRGLGAVDVLVVDITDNGGGSEWVDQVAGVFTDRPLRSHAVGFVKHPHWTERLEEQAARIRAHAADSALPAGARDTLAEAARRLEGALSAARKPCDRSFLWAGGEHLAPCQGTVVGALYGSGPFAWLPPGALADVPSRNEVYAFPRRPAAAWTGPVWILVDGWTASAAEQLPAVLADHGIARVVGEKTYGAGCGFTNGGIPLTLPHSGIEVWMPDCARYRRSGANEVEGVQPDVLIRWSEMDGRERAAALAEVLARSE